MKNTKPDHYWVVVAFYNEDTERYEFRVDDEMLVDRFPEGSLFDGNRWIYSDLDGGTDWELSQDLANTLDTYNLREAE